VPVEPRQFVVVPPVVGEPSVDQEALIGDVMNGQQLDGSDSKAAQMLDSRLGCKSGVGAAEFLGDPRMLLGEPLDVKLVDDRPAPAVTEQPVLAPVEVRIDHDASRDRRLVVGLVDLKVGVVAAVWLIRQRVRCVPVDAAVDRLRVRVDQELRRVEAQATARLIRSVHAVRVALPRPHSAHVRVPLECCAVPHVDPAPFPVIVVQAELDALGVLGPQ